MGRVSERLRRRKSTAPLSAQKGAVSHQVRAVPDEKYADEKIDMLDFDEVIEIDPERRICIVEQGVSYTIGRRLDRAIWNPAYAFGAWPGQAVLQQGPGSLRVSRQRGMLNMGSGQERDIVAQTR